MDNRPLEKGTEDQRKQGQSLREMHEHRTTEDISLYIKNHWRYEQQTTENMDSHLGNA